MERSKLKIRIYAITMFLTIIIFSLGLTLGILLNQVQSSVIEDAIIKMRESTDSFDLQFLFLDVFKEGNITCKFMNYQLTQLGREAAEIGTILETYVSSRNLGEEFKDLKRTYTLTIIRDWLMMEKVKQKCGGNYSTVLYFYADDKNCPACESQADILGYYKKLLGDELMVFALDSELNITIVDALGSSYGIMKYPTLVVDGTVYQGFVNSVTFKEAINYSSST